ncbi:two-component regulator propeller domain-containing protein [Pedobacter sp. B4-66]|uniref:hybrid sensor histidine kinase/response regulator transcription factor n=1 Tax=Pedobacter sp. B4-66 TaxID=2817280 RepID=UPI001BD94512|nr:two-component regulator propeller domain-containing protein [Pedobacter sp. B4-66]
MKTVPSPNPNIKISGILLLLFLLVNKAFAIDPFPIGYLGIENGLSNNAVTSIHQDHYGFMWFGTYDGLNRYNGYEFKVFRNRHNDSLSLINNRIVAIAEDKNNRIWVGTKSGVSIFDPLTAKFSALYYYQTKKSERKVVDFIINDIEADQSGNVFIATAGKGLLLYNKTVGHAVTVKLDTDTDTHVQAIKIDGQQRVWVFIQHKGLYLYHKKTNSLRLVYNKVHLAKCMEVDKKGNIWIGADIGLYQFNSDTRELRIYDEKSGDLSSNNVVGLNLDKAQNLWIATDGGGVNILDSKTGKMSHLLAGKDKNSLTSGAVYAIYEDKDTRKWIGTLRGGINIIDQQKNKFKTVTNGPLNRNSLVNNFILSFCEVEDGNIFIGKDGGGLSYWNRKENEYINFKHDPLNNKSLPNDYVTSIVKDYRNNIWMSTYGGGICKYNGKTGLFERFVCYNDKRGYDDRNTWILYEDRNKVLWAGTCNGAMYQFNRATNRFELFDDSLWNVISIAEDKAGNLWVGTFTELIKIDKNNKKHTVLNVNYPVRTIHESRSGHLWVGTEGGGIRRYESDRKKFVQFFDSDGLANNSVLNILEDKDGMLWISTFNGLSSFDPKSEKFKNFYESDGLQSNQFNYNAATILKSGEFLFGGIKGFNIFTPKDIKPYNNMPQTLLTRLSINNVPLEQSQELAEQKSVYDIQNLTLSHEQAMLSIDFVALEYSAPDKISYAYYLEGWDNSWNYVGKLRTANYSRLNEGNYILRIKSTNAEGIWNVNERVIYITILPPWYRTWWAYLAYGGLAAAFIYCYLLYKTKQTKMKYELEIAHMQTEKEKELNEKKLSFFTNISHEFRTPLTLIINPIKELVFGGQKSVDPKDLSIVYRNARRLLSLVDQLLLFRKTESEDGNLKLVHLNISNLCREVFLCFTHQAKSKNVRYEFECDNEDIMIYADREKMEIVLLNLISNALKFVEDGGSVIIGIKETEAALEISVKDDGLGIPEETGEKLFNKFYQVKRNDGPLKIGFGIGLYLVKNFIDSHKGEINYESKPGSGTTFRIELKKGRAHLSSNLIFGDVEEHSPFLEELIEEMEPVAIENNISEQNNGLQTLFSDNRSMLIVDDNVQIREYLKKIFSKKYILYEADNGVRGLQLAYEYLPDIIISDVLMPGMSGIELCNKIKEDSVLSHIPVILLTASSSAEIKLKGIEGGADDYISKPFENEMLIARIEGLFKSRNNLQKYFYNEITLKSNNLKVSTEYKEFLDRCISIVEERMTDVDFNIKSLASELGMSHSNLYKRVKSISGKSVNCFIRFIRLRKAAEHFINTSCNVNEAAYSVGMNDIKHFREEFYKLFGINPSEYIKKYRKNFGKEYKLNRGMVDISPN